MVHVEELFEAVARFAAAVRKAGYNAEAIKLARMDFQDFCIKHNLPVDFTPPEDMK